MATRALSQADELPPEQTYLRMQIEHEKKGRTTTIPKELDGRQQLGIGPFAGVAAEQSDESLLEADGQRRQNVADLIVQLETCNMRQNRIT